MIIAPSRPLLIPFSPSTRSKTVWSLSKTHSLNAPALCSGEYGRGCYFVVGRHSKIPQATSQKKQLCANSDRWWKSLSLGGCVHSTFPLRGKGEFNLYKRTRGKAKKLSCLHEDLTFIGSHQQWSNAFGLEWIHCKASIQIKQGWWSVVVVVTHIPCQVVFCLSITSNVINGKELFFNHPPTKRNSFG